MNYLLIHTFILINCIVLFLIILIRKRKICQLMPLKKFEKIIAVWMLILTTITTIFVVYPILTGKSSDTIAYESYQRINGTIQQGYRLTIINSGNTYAENVEVEISFPFQNCTITEIWHSDEELIGNESWGIDSYKYRVIYPKIRENKEIRLTVLIKNSDFEQNSTEIVLPIEKRIWVDNEGLVDIIYKYEQFIYY